MCMRCEPLLKAIDAYIQKADDSLADELEKEGYCKGKQTAKVISDLENEIAEALTEETDYILAEADGAIDLETFEKDIWPRIKDNDALRKNLVAIFETYFSSFVPRFAAYYLSELDKGLKIMPVSKRTTAWVESWSKELADIMQLNSHKEIETILKRGLKDGASIAEFSRNIMDSGIRDEWYKARRTAVTEVLTVHSVAQQEAFIQSPSTKDKRWRHSGVYIHGPRENHKDMDGRRIPKGAAYELRGADGKFYHPMFPRDPILPPGERIECHCLSQGIVDEDILGLSVEELKQLQREGVDEWNAKYEKERSAAEYTGESTAEEAG